MLDIRRAIESIVTEALWDFSIPNDGGTEEQYESIVWSDERAKPTWAELIQASEAFVAADAAARRAAMSCGPLQLRRALRQVGLYDAVTAAVATAGADMQEAWEYVSDVKRTEPMIEAMRLALGKTDEEVDAIFELAITL